MIMVSPENWQHLHETFDSRLLENQGEHSEEPTGVLDKWGPLTTLAPQSRF